MNNRGIGLIFIIFIISALILFGGVAARSAFNTASSLYLQKDHMRAFYLAEGAIEYGKTELKKNPNWHTDIRSSGDLEKWLKGEARGENVFGLSCKAVKIKATNSIYGVGYSGQACAIIKLDNGRFEEL